MSKGKKIVAILITVLVITALIGGGVYAYKWNQDNKLFAQVQPVENIIWYYSGEEMTSSGMVTNDDYQDVYLLDEKTVSEVYVEEGQEVKVGDPLMAYDMTLTELELEIQQLEVETIKNKITLANRELKKLRNTTPISEIVEIPEPVIKPEPVQVDATTGAYHFISGDTENKLAAKEGKGTLKNPYIIYCMPDCYVEGAYLNNLAANEKAVFVRLQVIHTDTGLPNEDKFWELNSKKLSAMGMSFDEMARWSVETKQPVIEEEIWEEEIIEEIPEPQGYTAAELAAAIKEKENDLKNYDLQRRQAELKLEQMQSVAKDGVVKATIDGIVKSVGDIDNPDMGDSTFISVSGSQGLYVTGHLSELQLEDIQVGQIIYANSWESGMSFEATIQEISPYPSKNGGGWGEGNPNVSYYPYTAYIENTEGLRNGEYVDLTMTPSSMNQDSMEMSSLYVQKPYVREENGKSYVLIADENNRLKKQYVETGKTIYGEAIEIKAGLSIEDRIAFPYGKTAKEGLKVEDASNSGMMYY